MKLKSGCVKGRDVSRFVGRTFAALLFLTILTLQVNGSEGATVTPSEKKAYLHALMDAKETTQDEVSRNLLALVPGPDTVNSRRLSGSEIRWEGTPGHSRVLVAAFMSRSSYEKYYKSALESGAIAYTLTKSLWVTVVPELSNAFINRAYETCPPKSKRVVKLLGLNPAYDYDVVLELWVDPRNLFRPSADPETTDHESELATRVTDNFWIFPSDTNPFMSLNAARFTDHKGEAPVPFKKWYTDRAKKIYDIGNPDDPSTWGYPWTRLGYTYDWGNPGNHVGLSEFVIRIDPEQNGGETIVTLERAIECKSPEACGEEWDQYFRCEPEASSARDAENGFSFGPHDLN